MTQEKCQAQARVVTVCISTSEHVLYEFTAHIVVYISFSKTEAMTKQYLLCFKKDRFYIALPIFFTHTYLAVHEKN